MKQTSLFFSLLALLFFVSFQGPLTASHAPVTRATSATMGQKASFTVPGYQGELEVVDVVLLDVVFHHDLDWGVENLLQEPVGVVKANMYIAHRIEAPNGAMQNQPSYAQIGSSDYLEAFDGVIDMPNPDGPSGYWGPAAVNHNTMTQGGLIMWGASQVDWKQPRVELVYAPWSNWEWASPVPNGHWMRWRDAVVGRIDSIGSVRYVLEDGSEVTIPF